MLVVAVAVFNFNRLPGSQFEARGRGRGAYGLPRVAATDLHSAQQEHRIQTNFAIEKARATTDCSARKALRAI